jgi:hypothetical protein
VPARRFDELPGFTGKQTLVEKQTNECITLLPYLSNLKFKDFNKVIRLKNGGYAFLQRLKKVISHYYLSV